MVHALNEIHRVLASGGILIDLRPLVDLSPVEVVSGSKTVSLAGRVSQLPEDIANDEAANKAIAKAAEQNWFIQELEAFFPFFYCCDSPEEMQAYVEGEWADFVTISEEVWRNVRSMWAIADAEGLLRIQLKMMIARWRVVKGNVSQQFN
jgi:hypothetical protein